MKLSQWRQLVAVLWVAVLVSALGVVYGKQEARTRFNELQKLTDRRDAGSPVWRPIVDGGTSFRFAVAPSDLVDEEFDQTQRHVDPTRHARRGDQPCALAGTASGRVPPGLAGADGGRARSREPGDRGHRQLDVCDQCLCEFSRQ